MKSFFTPGKVSSPAQTGAGPSGPDPSGPNQFKPSLSPPQPKSANVLGAVNKPLSSAGKQLQSKSFRMETASNEDSSSNPGSPQRSKTRYHGGGASRGMGRGLHGHGGGAYRVGGAVG